jgi:hypothetical protein
MIITIALITLFTVLFAGMAFFPMAIEEMDKNENLPSSKPPIVIGRRADDVAQAA